MNNWPAPIRWIIWLSSGAFLGEFLLCMTAFLWCLPYMTDQSYCTGDAPFVGYMLIASSPFAILCGAGTAGVLLRKSEIRETLRKQEIEIEKLKVVEQTALDAATPTNAALPEQELID